jgi:hypothetical protein
MKPTLPSDDPLQVRLDRLVDGQLPPAEYQSLLRQLQREHAEGRTDAWRDCALTFLEHQALKKEFASLLDEASASANHIPQGSQVERPAPSGKSGRSAVLSNRWLQSGALALSLLLTFWLGRESVWPVKSHPANPTVTRGAAPKGAAPNRVVADTHPAQQQLADQQLADQQLADQQLADQGPRLHGVAHLVVDGPYGSQEIEVPVFGLDYANFNELLQAPPRLPSDLVEAAWQSGHEIHSERTWVPLEVDSQRSIAVPVDRVRVTPAGGRPVY